MDAHHVGKQGRHLSAPHVSKVALAGESIVRDILEIFQHNPEIAITDRMTHLMSMLLAKEIAMTHCGNGPATAAPWSPVSPAAHGRRCITRAYQSGGQEANVNYFQKRVHGKCCSRMVASLSGIYCLLIGNGLQL